MTQLNVQVRRATSADADALSAFASKTFALGGRRETDPAHVAAYIATELTPKCLETMIASPNIKVFLAQLENEIVGYVALVRDSPHQFVATSNPSELRKLYVDPEFHGGGIADRLMREALRQIESDCDAVWLSVYAENPRAIAFYTRWGFRVVGTQDFYVGSDAQKDFVMQRDSQKGV